MTDENNNEPQKKAVDDEVLREMEGVPEHLRGDTDEDSEEGSLDDALGKLKGDLETAMQDVLYARAETQNVRRRLEKDVQDARNYAATNFARDVLSVADNLDRALAAADTEDEALKPILEGVELTRKSLLDALARHNVEQIDPTGQPFDPEFHEAMAMVPNPSAEPNSVIDVMQKGYTLNGRLLRAAMVVVAKAE